MAGQDRPGRDRVRARGFGHRQLRAPDRRHGRARRPGDSGRAPVHRDRAASGDRAAAQGRPARDGGAARERRLLVHARRGWRPAARAVRARGALLLSGRTARRCRVRAVPRGPRAPDPAHRGGDQPRAGVRRSRGEAGVQRRHPVHAGRQPDHRPGLGTAQLLAERGPQLRHHRGRRRRLAARRVDRRGRADDRHAGRRPAALRRLREQGVFAPEERGGLRQRLHDPLPGRGAPGRAAAAHGAVLRPHAGAGRGVRPEVRLGAPELVRAQGHAPGGPLVVPALEVVRARGQRMQDMSPRTSACST